MKANSQGRVTNEGFPFPSFIFVANNSQMIKTIFDLQDNICGCRKNFKNMTVCENIHSPNC